MATCLSNVAASLDAQGKYAEAQPLYEHAVEIQRRLLGDDHPGTASIYNHLAWNLNAQGKYSEARGRWQQAVNGSDAARLRIAFAGLERARTAELTRRASAAVLARAGRQADAWQALSSISVAVCSTSWPRGGPSACAR